MSALREASGLEGAPRQRTQLLQRILFATALTLAGCQLATAQSVSKMEFLGGYSHLWENTKHTHGWNASVAASANRWLSLVGDLSGHHPANETEFRRLSTTTFDVDQYRFYFGPRFSIRKMEQITPYFHLLLGVAHTRIATSGTSSSQLPPTGPFPFSVEQSTNRFSGMAGVGLDIKASERIALRLIQTDYIRDGGQASGLCRLVCSHSLRFSSGIVIRLGHK